MRWLFTSSVFIQSLHRKKTRNTLSDFFLKISMSEKWETVGTGKTTSKKNTNNNKALTNKPANAKKEKMVYTMEDILPASSVVNSFASAFDPVPTPKSPKKETK